MKVPRSPARVWIDVLRRIMPVLAASEANDVVLFGSQAMSVYTPRALASKDLDLIVPGVTVSILEKLCVELAGPDSGRPEYDFMVGEYSGRRYPLGHIYLKHAYQHPLVVEFFQTFLGFETRRLTPFLTLKERWGMRFQVLTPEAIVGSRLSFRPPERITPFNARRLARFISSMGEEIDWSEVVSFMDAFDLRGVAIDNLRELKSRHIFVPGSSNILEG
jgi:hypothetical protein